jgi:hypothetical protein
MSLASIGLTAAGDIMKGEGAQAADVYAAARAQRAAEYGRLAASQAGAQYTEHIVSTLAHMDAVQAARKVDPTSPSAVAVREYQEFVGERARTIKVESLLAQAQQDEADAAYYRQAGSFALMQGYLGAGADVAGGLFQAFKPGGSLGPNVAAA